MKLFRFMSLGEFQKYCNGEKVQFSTGVVQPRCVQRCGARCQSDVYDPGNLSGRTAPGEVSDYDHRAVWYRYSTLGSDLPDQCGRNIQ